MNNSGAITVVLTSSTVSNFTPSNTGPYSVYSSIVKWVIPDLGIDYLVNSSTRTNLSYGQYLVEYSIGYPQFSGSASFQPLLINVSSGVTVSVLNTQDTTCGLNNGLVTGFTTSQYNTSSYNLFDINDNLFSSVICSLESNTNSSLTGLL